MLADSFAVITKQHNVPGESTFSHDFIQVLSKGYATGRAYFGELGLDFNTYSDRIQSIVRKDLGPFVSENETVAFATKLHLRDLYLAIACAKEGLGFSMGDINPANHESLGWKALERVPQIPRDPETTVLFNKNDVIKALVSGGDANAPGNEFAFSWQAPGPVINVTGTCLVGYCEVNGCDLDGNTARCRGWTNGSNLGPVRMVVRWRQLQEPIP